MLPVVEMQVVEETEVKSIGENCDAVAALDAASECPEKKCVGMCVLGRREVTTAFGALVAETAGSACRLVRLYVSLEVVAEIVALVFVRRCLC
jgi:hypothetical protein